MSFTYLVLSHSLSHCGIIIFKQLSFAPYTNLIFIIVAVCTNTFIYMCYIFCICFYINYLYLNLYNFTSCAIVFILVFIQISFVIQYPPKKLCSTVQSHIINFLSVT